MHNICKIVAGSFIFFFSLSACGYPCGKASAHIILISYTEQESDTIILRRFVKERSFKELKDSLLLTASNANFVRQSDTLFVLHNIEGYEDITADYDYEIYIPNATRTYKLSNISEDFKTGDGGCNKNYCVNSFKSYKIDEELINVTDYSAGIYLNK